MILGTQINYLAVLVATIACMIVGFLWYSPFLFGKSWMKEMGFTDKSMNEKKKKGMFKSYIAMFVIALISNYILSHFINYLQANTVSLSLQTAFWLWLGFIVPISLGSILWEGKSLKLFVINSLQHLVSLGIASIIIGLWM